MASIHRSLVILKRLIHYRCLLIVLIIVSIWHGHLPLPTDVRHVQPLKCISSINDSNWPDIAPIPKRSVEYDEGSLTVVLVTARPEFQRLPLTLAALAYHLDRRNLSKVMLLVPSNDVSLLENFFVQERAKVWPWPVSIQADDGLIKHRYMNSYLLQMMFKLVLAQIIETEYYLILDSDCVALRPIHVNQLLYPTIRTNGQREYRAIYQGEGKSAHANWWRESEGLMQISLEQCIDTVDESSSTMGVTPSILSRTIALRTLCRLQKLYGDEQFLNRMAFWGMQRLIFGDMWTEYTLYYLTGRCTKLFDRYHIHYSNFPPSSTFPRLSLTGFSIWSSVDWTMQNQKKLIKNVQDGLLCHEKECQTNKSEGIRDDSKVVHGLFTVLQGRHGVDPLEYHRLLYPIYSTELRKRHRTKTLAELLDEMATHLISM